MKDEGVDTVALRNESESQKGQTVPRKWFEEQISHYVHNLKTPVKDMLE
jgi:hypothetical protein